METIFITFGLPLLCGLIFTTVAAALFAFPPGKINSFYGYRTANSMKSEAHWKFAQRYSAFRLLEGGVSMMLISLKALWFILPKGFETTLNIALVLFVVLYVLFSTEKALKAKFPTD